MTAQPTTTDPSLTYPRRGQAMGYWLSEPSIREPARFVAAIHQLADAGYALVRVVLRNTNYTHRSPEVVAAVALAADAAQKRGLRLALDCEPHSRPVAADMGRQFPEAMGSRLVRASATLVQGRFRAALHAPETQAQMPAWDGVECAFVETGGQTTRIEVPDVHLDWEIETYRDGDTRLRQDYTEGRPVAERRLCRLTGVVPGHESGTLILYVRFADTGLVDFWAAGLREYYRDLLERYRGIPLAGAGWDEPAIGGDWDSYRYGAAFAEAFQSRAGYALADRAFLLDAPEATPESVQVRLDYYATLNEGVVQAQAEFVRRTKELFGDRALLGTHHTWQGEGGINDYRAGAVDYFRLADTQDAGYTDCWWWDRESVCYAYVLASSVGRTTPTGQAEVNSWHAKPTNTQVDFQARLMSLFNVTWFNLWFGDNADTCWYPAHYTWSRTQQAMRRHDGVQAALDGLRPVVEIAVWHGWEGVTGLNSAEFANAHKTCVMNLSALLTDRSVPFDFVDSRVLESGTVVEAPPPQFWGAGVGEGKTAPTFPPVPPELGARGLSTQSLQTTLGRYRVLVLPYAAVIPEAVWAVCRRFAEAGGHLVWTGPPPSLTVEGRDITAEFAALLGLTRPLPLAAYTEAMAASYTLPRHRAAFLDCGIALDTYTDRVSPSAEDAPMGAMDASGRVVYLSDLDPRGRLLDRVQPWLSPAVECFSDSILWRLYAGEERQVLVLIAREERRMQGIVRFAGQEFEISGGTFALAEIAGGTLQITGEDVSWRIL